MYCSTYFKCFLTEIRLHSLSPCFYHSFLPCKASFCSHSFQSYIRTPVFPTLAKMIPTPRKHYPIPVQHIHASCPILLQPPKIGNQTEKLVMILLWADWAVQGARTGTQYCRKWLLTTCMKTALQLRWTPTQQERHELSQLTSYWHDPKSLNLGIWQNS